MNHRRRGKRLTLLTGSMLLVLVAVLAVEWERALDIFYALRTGYEFIRMPDGVSPCEGRSLNNSGQVAVEIQEGELETAAGSWSVSGEELHLLGTLPGCEPGSGTSAINSDGNIVGLIHELFTFGMGSILNGRHAFHWTPERGMVEIPNLGGLSIKPADISDKNQVVGFAAKRQYERAFLWEQLTGIRELGQLAGEGNSYAVGISGQGWIAGNAVAADRSTHPVLWKPDCEIMDLGFPAGYSGGCALAINDRNEVLVNAERLVSTTGSNVSKESVPFVWSGEKGYAALPLPTGYDDVTAISINNHGHVLFTAKSSSRHAPSAFIFADGKLTQLPPARRGLATFYTCLNDKGWLSGYIETAEGGSPDLKARRGFVARPFRFGSN